ncbi:hypothetical protein BH10PSE19_BH10PSE19_19100 [soil metagenome]
MEEAHLVIIGFGEVVAQKYMHCIAEAIKRGEIGAYSIVELASQKNVIDRRIQSVTLKPENIFYIPEPAKGTWADVKDFEPIVKQLKLKKYKLKVYIATEAKAHEAYLKYCVENGIDSLVEKPVIAPIKDGCFDPIAIQSSMQYLLKKAKANPAHHSVMTFARYHRIYNEEILEPLKLKMLELQAPLTSLHLRTNSGVWNLYKEFEEREDHPYKYGYGMLMHNAYHYVDLMAQFLQLNKLIFPQDRFSLTLSSFAAYPSDQSNRIPVKFSEDFEDVQPDWAKTNTIIYGETDITSTFCLKNIKTNKVITVGTLSLEQTTPCIRSWKDLPKGIYNKNGRTSCTDIEAQLSVLFSIHGRCYKTPKHSNQQSTHASHFAQVSTRANASLLANEEFNSVKTFSDYTHSSSKYKIIDEWLKGTENKSQLESHVIVMNIIQSLALSLQKPGYPVTLQLY